MVPQLIARVDGLPEVLLDREVVWPVANGDRDRDRRSLSAKARARMAPSAPGKPGLWVGVERADVVAVIEIGAALAERSFSS